MNKRPAHVSRKKELENELLSSIEQRKGEIETGHVARPTMFKIQAAAQLKQFEIKQGNRRRHPQRVLSNYDAITKDTVSAETAWEKSLMHEQQRTEIPQEYQPQDKGMIANQLGLVTTALDNFAKSKGKFNRQFIAGV